MKNRLLALTSILILAVLLLSSGRNLASAQEITDPRPSRSPHIQQVAEPYPGPDSRLNEAGQRTSREEGKISSDRSQPTAPAVPQATGGPDEYGYVWDDTIPLAWIDATSGTDTGMSGDGWDQAVGPVSLPFTFKYYENTYSQLWITAPGYVSFTETYYWPQQRDIPDSGTPNNVIAPYWSPTYIGSGAWVRYKSGGVSPNRYFVVEWHDVHGGDPDDEIGGGDVYRFEVVLHENGNIDFQYQTMAESNGNWWCGQAGIEDSDGTDGLQYWDSCPSSFPPSNRAVRFTRPAPAARVVIKPGYFGSFASPGGAGEMVVPIRNLGELGTDTYDLNVASAWPVSLYMDDGVTLLVDTDADGLVDTGPVSQGATVNIIARMQAPAGALVGNANNASLTATSSINTSKSKTVTLQAAIPTKFAQVYLDDYDGAENLYLVQPGAQYVKQTTGLYRWGWGPAVAETPNGNFIHAWYRGRCTTDNCDIYVDEIEYAVTNAFGEIVKPVARLVNNGAVTIDTYDYSPTVAAAGDGKIGIVWLRQLYRDTSGYSEWNYNIYFSILNQDGTPAYGPANLTNNTTWTGSTPDAPRYDDPRIAATSNSFALAWERYQYFSSCTENDCSLNDIYYSVRSTSGSLLYGLTNITNDTAGSDYEAYYYPNLASLNSNRLLLLWNRSSDDDIYYAVLDSAGTIIKSATDLSADGYSYYDYTADAAQLSDGKIAVAWSAWDGDAYHTRFAVLDASYNRSVSPVMLSNPAAPDGEYSVSVAADQSGRAVLTTTEDTNNPRNLYYALVNSTGGVVTQPMIFRSTQSTYPSDGFIESSYEGYGNTSYSTSIEANADGAILVPDILNGGAPGGTAAVYVGYSNHGQATASGVNIVMTLPMDLEYVSDTSGVVPLVSSNQVTWNLPDVSFLDEQGFTVYLGVPDVAPIGTKYSLDFQLGVTGDANLTNNHATTWVMAAIKLQLPIMYK